MQRYRDKKIRVCDKNSIPLYAFFFGNFGNILFLSIDQKSPNALECWQNQKNYLKDFAANSNF